MEKLAACSAADRKKPSLTNQPLSHKHVQYTINARHGKKVELAVCFEKVRALHVLHAGRNAARTNAS
jgi:hypothetical protein